MSENGKAQARSKEELCEKLRDLMVKQHQVNEKIRETEKQIDRLQQNDNQPG